nr:MAG TPA: hypothetical protein [Caudoviricetes sp.]
MITFIIIANIDNINDTYNIQSSIISTPFHNKKE